MTPYVFDTNSFINLFTYYYKSRFPSLWDRFDGLINQNKIISVREVKNEVSGNNEELTEWVDENRDIFLQPSQNELDFVREIFEVKHFQNNIRKKEILKGNPVADPFLIAKAKLINGTVVTEEKRKPNSAQIPNICEKFNVNRINLEDFMIEEEWVF